MCLMLTDVVLWYFSFFSQRHVQLLLSFCFAERKRKIMPPVVNALGFFILKPDIWAIRNRDNMLHHIIIGTRPTKSIRTVAFSSMSIRMVLTLPMTPESMHTWIMPRVQKYQIPNQILLQKQKKLQYEENTKGQSQIAVVVYSKFSHGIKNHVAIFRPPFLPLSEFNQLKFLIFHLPAQMHHKAPSL